METLYCVLAAAACALAADPPQVEISNAAIRAKLYLPDAEKGYYRATRFDWSGVVASLEHKGHNYFGVWFERYDPKLHDAITGPVESFNAIGYDDGRARRQVPAHRRRLAAPARGRACERFQDL